MYGAMETPDFRLYRWIKNNSARAKHNLSSSGLSEPDLKQMGVSTDYAEFRERCENPEEEFRSAVAELYGVRPENVLPTVGGTEAIYLVSLLMSHRARHAHVPLPNYEPMVTLPRLLGMVEAGLDAPGPLYVAATDTNNPTGRSLEEGWLEHALGALDGGSRIFVDETFREFGFREQPATWFHRDPERILVSNTLTKFYGLGGFRVGWIIASEREIGALSRLKPYLTGENPAYSLWVGAQTLRNRPRFVARARRIVERNRKIVEEFVESTPKIRWSDPDAAPFCLVEYEGEASSEKLCEQAVSEAGVLVAPAEFFGAKKGFRLCFTHSEEQKLVEALDALSRFLGERLR